MRFPILSVGDFVQVGRLFAGGGPHGKAPVYLGVVASIRAPTVPGATAREYGRPSWPRRLVAGPFKPFRVRFKANGRQPFVHAHFYLDQLHRLSDLECLVWADVLCHLSMEEAEP